ncbi:MAG: zf-HC2 domain-containing protein [Anaerolineales bacterium]
MNEHITSEQVIQFISGDLSAETRDGLLAHIDACDACLLLMDQIWADILHQLEIPDLGSHRAKDVERQIFRRIHAIEVGKQALRLAFVGPLAVLKGLVEPFSRQRKNPKSE